MPGRRQHGEGSVYRRANGQWVAVADLGWRGDRRDRREFTSFTSLEDALERRAQFLHARRDGFTLPRGQQPTVAEWVRHWLHNVTRVGESSWRAYRQKTEDYIVPFFARVRLAEVTEEDVEAWHQWLRQRTSRTGEPLSPSTVAAAHRVLSIALNAATGRRKLPHNPCRYVPPPKAERAEITPPSVDEVNAIIAACTGRPGGARWVVALTTGLRQMEVLRLTWRDVRLTAPASVTVRQGKTPKARRTVDLPGSAVAALKAHRAQAMRNVATDLVFTGPDGQAVEPTADWRAWRELLGELGLPLYRIHDLRHAYATMLLEAGTDVRVVQEFLGHASPAFTQSAYQHVRAGLRQQAAAAFDQLLGGDG